MNEPEGFSTDPTIVRELEVGNERKKLIQEGDIVRHRQQGDREYVFMYARLDDDGKPMWAVVFGPKNRAKGANAQFQSFDPAMIVVPRKKKTKEDYR